MTFETNKGKVDTKKLSDKDAAIHEAVANLYKVCQQYNVPMFCRAILHEKRYCGAQFFGSKKPSEVNFMFDLMGKFVEDSSGGDVVMVRVKK